MTATILIISACYLVSLIGIALTLSSFAASREHAEYLRGVEAGYKEALNIAIDIADRAAKRDTRVITGWAKVETERLTDAIADEQTTRAAAAQQNKSVAYVIAELQ